MIHNGMFSIAVPTVESSASQSPSAIIVQANTNYYTDNFDRGTMCCSCDKAVVAL